MVWNSHFAHSRKTISLLIYDYRHVEMARTRRAGNHVCCKEQNSVQHQLCSNLLQMKWVFRLPLSLSQSNYNVLLCKVLILLTSSLLRWLRGRFPIIHKEKESRSISTLCADGLYFIPVSHLPVISASPWTLMWAIFFVPRPWGAVFKKKRRKKKTSLKKKPCCLKWSFDKKCLFFHFTAQICRNPSAPEAVPRSHLPLLSLPLSFRNEEGLVAILGAQTQLWQLSPPCDKQSLSAGLPKEKCWC